MDIEAFEKLRALFCRVVFSPVLRDGRSPTHKAMKRLIMVTLIIIACVAASALFVATDVRAQSAEAAENRAKLQRVLRAARGARR